MRGLLAVSAKTLSVASAPHSTLFSPVGSIYGISLQFTGGRGRRNRIPWYPLATSPWAMDYGGSTTRRPPPAKPR